MSHRKTLAGALLGAACIVLAGCGEDPQKKAASAPPPAAAPSGSEKYAATMEEGIKFATPGLPDFVSEVSGISIKEPWGRWTTGPVATIRFAKPLPSEFDLEVRGAAYGPNVGQPVDIVVDGVTQKVTFKSALGQPMETHRVRFKPKGAADRVEIRIPKPTAPPKESGDVRQLGVALASLKILPPK